MRLLSYPTLQTFVLCAQKNHLNETASLSTHNICFSCEKRNLNFNCTPISGDQLKENQIFFKVHRYVAIYADISIICTGHQKMSSLFSFNDQIIDFMNFVVCFVGLDKPIF